MAAREIALRKIASFFTRLADLTLKTPTDLPKIISRTLGGFLFFEFVAGAITVGIDTLRSWRPAPAVSFPVTESPAVTVQGNEMQVFTSGSEVYQAMLDEIRHAKRNVFFETFIWKCDEVGRLFKDALVEAANRGVHVFIIWDAFGNLNVPPNFTRFPRLPRLHVMRFGLLRSFFLSLRSTGRDHRKLLVVDNRVGFIGGYNIGALYADCWRDTHVRIKGEATLELANAFTEFWNTHLNPHQLPSLPKYPGKRWCRDILAAKNEPNRLLFPVRGLYINALSRAQKNVWITQAYFIPDKDILDELTQAANRGVDVKVLIPEISNHIAADWVARSFYSQLLEAGVEIWLYQNAMVHAKTATADGIWTTIGTANIDRLSMTGNYEINMEVYSKKLAHQMEKVFVNDLSNARQLNLVEWEGRPWLNRVIEKLLRPLGSLL